MALGLVLGFCSMKRCHVLIALTLLFAGAEFIMPATSEALAPMRLGPKTSGNSLEDQATTLWPQFEKTAAALEKAVSNARTKEESRPTRDELKAMITLRLLLREMALRTSISREELASLQSEIQKMQQVTKSSRLSSAFAKYRQQANQINATLSSSVKIMDENEAPLLFRPGHKTAK